MRIFMDFRVETNTIEVDLTNLAWYNTNTKQKNSKPPGPVRAHRAIRLEEQSSRPPFCEGDIL